MGSPVGQIDDRASSITALLPNDGAANLIVSRTKLLDDETWLDVPP